MSKHVITQNDEWDEFLNNDNFVKDSEKDTRTIENTNDQENSISIKSNTIDDDDDDQ